MAFQSYLCTPKIVPAAETALRATKVGRRLHKITAGHLALPSMPALPGEGEGKSFWKALLSSVSTAVLLWQTSGFLHNDIEDTNSLR